jgi:hypothetical protein
VACSFFIVVVRVVLVFGLWLRDKVRTCEGIQEEVVGGAAMGGGDGVLWKPTVHLQAQRNDTWNMSGWSM